MRVVVYGLEFCPHCDELKKFLDDIGCPYDVLDMQSAEGKTELTFNGVFEIEAPVLQCDDEFFVSAQLFPGGVLDTALVMGAVRVY